MSAGVGTRLPRAHRFPQPEGPSPRRARGPAWNGWTYGLLDQIAGMVALTGRAIAACVLPPYSWWPEFVQESFLILRRCFIPLLVSTVAFGFGTPGVQADNLLSVFGTVDRSGAIFVMASVREFAPWINSMVLAGVAGTAVCADLGARKVRDELDALAVMGVDVVKSLVAPRFVALGVMTALLNMVAILFGLIGGMLAAVVVFGETIAGFMATFSSNFSMIDLLGSVIKTSLFGFIIAIVCCYKGMTASGGPQGVGRAVNQAVVIAFAGIWIFNYMFTATQLGAFPETGNLH